MAHLSALADGHLSVDVGMKSGLSECRRQTGVERDAVGAGATNQVEHGCGRMLCSVPEGQAQNGAEMLFELGRATGFDGVVA